MVRDFSSYISAASRLRYQQVLEGQLSAIWDASNEGQCSLVREIAHKIAGSAVLFGHKELSDICRELEQVAAKGDLLATQKLVSSTRDYFVANNCQK